MQPHYSCRLPNALLVGFFIALPACSGESDGDLVGGVPGTRGGDHPYGFLREGGLISEEVEATWAMLPYASISLERTSCFGSCPDYTVTFTRGIGEDAGPAAYEGRNYADRDGSYTGAISIWDYGRLCQLFDQFGFMTLNESYLADWTDDASVIVEVERNTTSRRVLDYGRQGPPELIALQLAIDAISNSIQWTEASVP